MLLNNIKNNVNNDIVKIDNIIKYSLNSNISLINDISYYITKHGGKRLRPLIVLLLSKACGYNNNKHLLLASVIELIHIATLLHDDVVDSSKRRRGKLTINEKWGNSEAILVGDFLYTRAFQIMLNINDFKILKIIANATNIMSEGEAIQLLNRNNKNITINNCLKIIKYKTSQLFIALASGCTVLAKCNNKIYSSIVKYGSHIGIAYQLIDDILDYINYDSKYFGKNIGDDFMEGIFTIPFICAIKLMNKNNRNFIMNIILKNDKNNFFKIRKIILESGGIIYAKNLVLKEILKAEKELSILPKSKFIKLLHDVFNFLINRTY